MPARNLQSDIRGKLSEGLDGARSILKVPLIFGHLCKGSLEKPGVLRISEISGEPPSLPLISTPCDHNKAFLRHVRRFGREKTLLNWLICWTRSALLTLSDTVNEPIIAVYFIITKAEDARLVSVDFNGLSTTVTISNALLETLLPGNTALNYLNFLYDDKRYNGEVKEQMFCDRYLPELEMISAKVQAMHRLSACNESTIDFNKLCIAYTHIPPPSEPTPNNEHRLQLLSALQIAFAYAKVFMPSSLDRGGFVSFGIPHHDTIKTIRNNKGDFNHVPVMAASCGVNNASDVSSFQTSIPAAATLKSFVEALADMAVQHGAAPPTGNLIGEKTKFSSAAAESLANDIPDNPPFKSWSTNTAKWIALLVSSLQGAKHEGGALEFTFVMGDMAKIEDSSAFELLELTDAGFDYPPAQDADHNSMYSALERTQKTIEKENYFWFQGGHYALLWDFTSPEIKPRYLVGLKDSSWRVFVENARNRKPSASAEAALIVGYLDERGGGGLIVQGKHAYSLTQKGEWIPRGETLSKNIASYLHAAGPRILNDNEIETLTKALVAVSNDPNSGCMLVLANSSKCCQQFETMGRPWRARIDNQGASTDDHYELSTLSDDKLVALLGMDGAACVWKENNSCRIAFRKLAAPPPSKKRARPTDDNVRNSLSGDGSRKWSSYLAATRKDVDLIVAVSQDGPVHFYSTNSIAKKALSANYSNFGIDCEIDNAVVRVKIGST